MMGFGLCDILCLKVRADSAQIDVADIIYHAANQLVTTIKFPTGKRAGQSVDRSITEEPLSAVYFHDEQRARLWNPIIRHSLKLK